jgi:hypothetical protein
VVVDNLNLSRALAGPAKAYTPLVIDADRILTFSVAFESFQPITGHIPQIIEARRSVHRFQLATGGLEKVGRKAFGAFAFEDRLGDLVFKIADDVRRPRSDLPS